MYMIIGESLKLYNFMIIVCINCVILKVPKNVILFLINWLKDVNGLIHWVKKFIVENCIVRIETFVTKL